VTTIKLPAGMAYVPCDDIALKIADAMYPDDGTDDEGWEIHHGTGWGDAEREIEEAVLSGALPVKKSTTHAPQTFLQGNAWKTGVVTIADLQAYLAERGITLAVADAPEPKAAPVVAGRKKWTPEKLAELKTYREAHTMPETAVKFGISEQRIRGLLPSEKPKAKPFAGLIHRMR